MNIYGELPQSDTVIFAACDEAYFLDHGPSFVYSASDNGFDVHVHIVNPTSKSYTMLNILNQSTGTSTTFTFNDTPPSARINKAYYACLRFLVLPTLQKAVKNILTLDIDCIVMKSFEMPDKPLGLFLREPLPGAGWETEGTRVAAGAVYTTQASMTFVERVAAELTRAKMQWFVDQFALWKVYRQISDKDNIEQFAPEFLDWEFHEGTAIWTGKGPRKYDNKKYVKAKIDVNRIEDAKHDFW
jgi:hypothetical protein